MMRPRFFTPFTQAAPAPVASSFPRRMLSPAPQTPWLLDTTTPRLGGLVMVGGFLLFWVGAIGGAMPGRNGMNLSVAIAFLLIGPVLCLMGIVMGSTGVVQQRLTQYCPECLSSMPRGATTCPACRYHPEAPHP